MEILPMLSAWSWLVVLIVLVVLYKLVLRFLFGRVIVPEDQIGLVGSDDENR